MDTYGNKQNNTKNHNLVKRVSQVVNAKRLQGNKFYVSTGFAFKLNSTFSMLGLNTGYC